MPFDDSVLQHLHRCRIISVAATGWDCVDVAAAAARGIRVSCVGEYCTQEVADHTLALLLALNRRLLAYHEQVQTHRDWRWNEVRDVQRLAGRTMGLIGFGRIGQAVCRRARAFGLEVLASDPRIDEQTARRHEARLCDVDELLAASHIVSLHCNLHRRQPRTAESRRVRAHAAEARCSSTWRAAVSSSRRTWFARSTTAR